MRLIFPDATVFIYQKTFHHVQTNIIPQMKCNIFIVKIRDIIDLFIKDITNYTPTYNKYIVVKIWKYSGFKKKNINSKPC